MTITHLCVVVRLSLRIENARARPQDSIKTKRAQNPHGAFVPYALAVCFLCAK